MRKYAQIAVMLMAVLVLAPMLTHATALSDDRDTPGRTGERLYIGVYTNSLIYAGAMVCLTIDGYAVAAADTAGYKVIGRAVRRVDNRIAVGDGHSGALSIDIERGVFRWENGSTLSDTNIGDFAYVEDDATVQTSGDVIAGVIVDVDGDGVWVDTYHSSRTAGSFTTLAVSGAATMSSTLAVTGVGTFSTNVTIAGSLAVSTTLGVTGLSTLGAVTSAGVLNHSNAIFRLNAFPLGTQGCVRGQLYYDLVDSTNTVKIFGM